MAQKRDSKGRFIGSGRSAGRSIGRRGTRVTTLGAVGGGDLAAAAEEIAAAARVNAASWSETIPPSIGVEVHGNTAIIYSDAPAAYPNEVEGVRHPTFGHDPWKTNKYRPFLGPAADARSGAAMARYAQKIDAMCRAAGFR